MPHTQKKKSNQEKMFPKETPILDTLFKSAIINTFKEIKKPMSKE